MNLGWKEWTRNDIIYGIVAPIIVILLIVGVSQLDQFFGGGFNVVTGIVMQLEELLVIVAIPLLLGLLWNKWAGGASGFIMGAFYALYWADSYRSPFSGNTFGANTILLGYVLSPILIGYLAGAMNKHSENFMRMIITGLFATTVSGILLFGIFNLSPINVVTGIDGFLLTVLTRTACGAIVPIIAKIFMWYEVNE
ncbi:MAG: hypothetical protein P8Y18_06890 [Candidatus Bathyarchaeota archaeon]